jgi:hypothetical protein
MSKSRAIPLEDANGNLPILTKNYEKYIRYSINSGVSLIFDMQGFNSFTAHIWNNVANPIVTFDTSSDGIYWHQMDIYPRQSYISGSSFRLSNTGSTSFSANKVNRYVRITQTASATFSICNVVLSQSIVHVKNFSPFLQDNVIKYTSSTALNVTTPLTIAGGTSPSFSSCIKSIQLYNAGTGESEIILKQGTNVIYRTFLSTKQSNNIDYSIAITDNSSSAITIELVSATNMLLYVSAQGIITSKNN